MRKIMVTTSRKKEVVDITAEVDDIVHEKKIEDGIVHVFATHTTCAITTANLDPGTDEDLLDAINAIMPNLNYRHPHDPKHVIDHIAASIIGPALSIPIENGELALGQWQRIIMIDFDGPREREIIVRIN